MAGKCKICGYQAGIFNLKDGICESCSSKQYAKSSVEDAESIATRSKIESSEEQNQKNEWGTLLKSSLLVGLGLSVVWMVIVLAAGAYNPSTASGISGLLGNAFGIFFVLSGVFFVFGALKNAVKSKISKGK